MASSVSASSASKAKGKVAPLSDQEISQNYSRMQSDLQALAGKIGELDQEADEHTLVLGTLNEALAEEPDRKCFRLIGGVLVERTVKDVVPALQTNRDGIKKVVGNLTEQYKTKENEFDAFKRDYNIRPATRS
ncbi:Prefoldin subunit-domain-containing protein [Mycena belliarum]|uniref:Prefoldin subunit-domain-containing protein n=1 Tax=Mycena belliarum TaxID=1033014 RepID=A0AAD6UDA4_9AGAR|nr:Prefoldin subunit-domain-containing protein [Mycena belliae]